MVVKVSAIVPVYNSESFLEKCLDTLVNQTLLEKELVIVNDGSKDASEQIIQSYMDKYPGMIQYISIPNGGVANARNIALDHACGEYITFCDSDDYFDLDMFEELYNKATSTGADIVVSGHYYEEENGKYSIKGLGNVEAFSHSLQENPEMIFHTNAYSCTKLFSKKMIDEHQLRFKKYRIFEDLLFFYSAMLVANKVEKVDKPFYHYIRRENTSVTGKMNEKFYDLYPVMQDLKDLYQGKIDQEYLTYVAIRHAYLRFKMNVSKDTLGLKHEYIVNTYAFLDVYDPNWKKNVYFKRRKRDKFIYKTVWYWMLQPYVKNLLKR